jgi:hypothetical protein
VSNGRKSSGVTLLFFPANAPTTTVASFAVEMLSIL